MAIFKCPGCKKEWDSQQSLSGHKRYFKANISVEATQILEECGSNLENKRCRLEAIGGLAEPVAAASEEGKDAEEEDILEEHLEGEALVSQIHKTVSLCTSLIFLVHKEANPAPSIIPIRQAIP